MNGAHNPFSLQGKRILVTGASSGIGQSIAYGAAKMGAEIVAFGRDKARTEETLSGLRDISSAKHAIRIADLTKVEELQSAVASVEGPLHGVVHAAGLSRLAPFRQMTLAHLREVNTINVEAPLLLTQAILRLGLVAPGGSILFISSIAAHIGVPGVGAYSGSKAALIAAMRCLAMEVVKRKIRANCLSPSLVVTPLFELAMQTAGSDSMARQEANHPLGFGHPDDVANASVFFLSDASRWITGTTLVMDGGLTIT